MPSHVRGILCPLVPNATHRQWPKGPVAPPENVEIYRLLFSLETMLRELVIDSLHRAFGPRWYLDHLPPDCKEHFRGGIDRDRQTKWTANVPHHPVYYLTFPDLRAIIEARENWNVAFSNVFPKNKDLVTTDLQELEFIRNKVAHNRRATVSDLTIVEAAFEKLCNEVGQERAVILAERYTIDDRIPEHLLELRREGDIAIALSNRGQHLKRLERWDEAHAAWWWFDEAYLGRSLKRITSFFDTMAEYCAEAKDLDRDRAKARGTDAALASSHAAARSDLTAILESWRHA